MSKLPQPTSIKKKSDTEMRIVWENGEESSIRFRDLRFHCRCAECLDEWTQKKKITIEQIPMSIKPVKVESVGRYAIKILWSDKHRTGIYTYDLLYGLSKQQQENAATSHSLSLATAVPTPATSSETNGTTDPL